jgi:hypothetical protein
MAVRNGDHAHPHRATKMHAACARSCAYAARVRNNPGAEPKLGGWWFFHYVPNNTRNSYGNTTDAG